MTHDPRNDPHDYYLLPLTTPALNTYFWDLWFLGEDPIQMEEVVWVECY